VGPRAILDAVVANLTSSLICVHCVLSNVYMIRQSGGTEITIFPVTHCACYTLSYCTTGLIIENGFV
jgi:hypothetical protein